MTPQRTLLIVTAAALFGLLAPWGAAWAEPRSAAPPELGEWELRQAPAQLRRRISCDLDACSARYRSFRAEDCTFQPYEGPRRRCTVGDQSKQILLPAPEPAPEADAAPEPSAAPAATIAEVEPGAQEPGAQEPGREEPGAVPKASAVISAAGDSLFGWFDGVVLAGFSLFCLTAYAKLLGGPSPGGSLGRLEKAPLERRRRRPAPRAPRGLGQGWDGFG